MAHKRCPSDCQPIGQQLGRRQNEVIEVHTGVGVTTKWPKAKRRCNSSIQSATLPAAVDREKLAALFRLVAHLRVFGYERIELGNPQPEAVAPQACDLVSLLRA